MPRTEQLSRLKVLRWPSTCKARRVSFDGTGCNAGAASHGPSYDALVQQHFRSTLPYWEQIYADGTVYGRIYQERARRALA